MDLRTLDPTVVAEQLGRPVGPLGIAIAEEMNRANRALNEAAFQLLAPAPGDTVLETGFGNGRLMPALLGLATDLKYTGLEMECLSPTGRRCGECGSGAGLLDPGHGRIRNTR
jgi:hypothetical protein